ncbi:MAG: hypothetical protein [Chaetfec virus UA24_244]|nr:MAG: hypothetical protein [Chaetfec virus UA24_244]
MSNIKERLFGAIAVMEEAEAHKLWEYILSCHNGAWDEIEEEDPDEIDLQMIQDAQNDPDCSEMASPEEIARVLGG